MEVRLSGKISTDASNEGMWLIPANEELIIAKTACRLLECIPAK